MARAHFPDLARQTKPQKSSFFLRNLIVYTQRKSSFSMLALQRQLTRRSALVGISRWSSTDSSVVQSWETKARKEAKGQDPYETFSSKNRDVGIRIFHAVWCF